jgi:hypothetical protein
MHETKPKPKQKEHKLLHGAKNPWCPMSTLPDGKKQHVPARRCTNVAKPKKFGQETRLEHVHGRSECLEGPDGMRDLLMIYDLATSCKHVAPVTNNTAALTIEGPNTFKGPVAKIGTVSSDQSCKGGEGSLQKPTGAARHVGAGNTSNECDCR